MYLITSDCDDILMSREPAQLTKIADAIIVARPGIYSIDAAGNDACHYPSVACTTARGNAMDVLLDAGIDPYGVVVKAVRDAGITFVANYRVNDHHGSPQFWTEWEREHKAWSLGKDTGAWKTSTVPGDRGWREIGDLRQMDYAIAGVRERRFGILSEIVARYPVDGLQLDFGRTAPFLSEPKREKAKYMTQFMRDVRAMLDVAGKERGQRLILSAVLPWDIAFCEAEGLDVRQWIKEGLLAYVAPGEWFYVDYNIPYREWVTLAKGSDCQVYPMFMSTVSSSAAVTEGKRVWIGDDYQDFDVPIMRALMENAYGQGVDGILFYNFYVRAYGDSYYPSLREWTDPAKIPSMTRHYYYARRLKYLPTEHYSFGLPDGYAPGEVDAFTPFPLDGEGDQARYPFLFGSRLGTSKADFQFKLRDLGDADVVEVRLNDQKIAPEGLIFRSAQPPAAPAFRFAVWQAALGSPPLKQGENVLNVTLTRRDPSRAVPVQVGELDLFVNPTER